MPILSSDFHLPRSCAWATRRPWPLTFAKPQSHHIRRERIDTLDDDFLDLDWSRVGSARLALVCHGLEGNNSRAYARGMVAALNRAGWDACAMSYRGCGSAINRTAALLSLRGHR